MDDARLVRGAQRLGDLDAERQRLSSCSAPRSSTVAQRVPLQVLLHHEVGGAVVGLGADVVDRGDVRMVQRRGGTRLLLEARQAFGSEANSAGSTLIAT